MPHPEAGLSDGWSPPSKEIGPDENDSLLACSHLPSSPGCESGKRPLVRSHHPHLKEIILTAGLTWKWG